jgi:hypothetical protein
MEATPLWLEQGLVRQLLERLVDRLDRAETSGSDPLRTLRVDAKLWPEFFRARFEHERETAWAQLTQICAEGWVAVSLDRPARGEAPYACAPRLRIVDADTLRRATGRPKRVQSPAERWRQAVAQRLQGSDAAKELAGRFRFEVGEHSLDDIVERLNRLGDPSLDGLSLREVSSRLFWGHSKMLDGREALVAALVERAECPYPASAVPLHVFIPGSEVRSVLFIENAASFERALRDPRSRGSSSALVWAAGFKAGAARLRHPAGASVFFSEQGSLAPALTAAFFGWLREGQVTLPVRFWGDLDHSGLAILKTLRGSFPDATAWEPGYRLMLEMLRDGFGHLPAEADKAGQRDAGLTGCDYADRTLRPELLRTARFVDQEAVDWPGLDEGISSKT